MWNGWWKCSCVSTCSRSGSHIVTHVSHIYFCSEWNAVTRWIQWHDKQRCQHLAAHCSSIIDIIQWSKFMDHSAQFIFVVVCRISLSNMLCSSRSISQPAIDVYTYNIDRIVVWVSVSVSVSVYVCMLGCMDVVCVIGAFFYSSLTAFWTLYTTKSSPCLWRHCFL